MAWQRDSHHHHQWPRGKGQAATRRASAHVRAAREMEMKSESESETKDEKLNQKKRKRKKTHVKLKLGILLFCSPEFWDVGCWGSFARAFLPGRLVIFNFLIVRGGPGVALSSSTLPSNLLLRLRHALPGELDGKTVELQV